MPEADKATDEIKALENRRYRAMLDGDTAVLDALCSGHLIYTHLRATSTTSEAIFRKSARATTPTSKYPSGRSHPGR